jgi:hypothetical protein
MKVEITKCYLVQVFDEDGNEVACQYVFGNREDAKQVGKELKKEKEGQE